MAVTIPEKTLEHWVSQYINYRYASKAGLWWPAAGEDISVDHLPRAPGKALQLEMKTSTEDSKSTRSVSVSYPQLCHYHARPRHEQPFYVFPEPRWPVQTLVDYCKTQNQDITELGFRRAGRLWFATWLRVLTTDEVARAVGHPQHPVQRGATSCPMVAKNANQAAKTADKLITYTYQSGTSVPTSSLATTSSASKTSPTPINFLDFWNQIDACGQTGWPQFVRLTKGSSPTTWQQATDAARTQARDPSAEFETFASGDDETVARVDLTGDARPRSDPRYTETGESNRLVVHLSELG